MLRKRFKVNICMYIHCLIEFNVHHDHNIAKFKGEYTSACSTDKVVYTLEKVFPNFILI